MSRAIKKRAYESQARRDAANATRKRILNAAQRIFLKNGYAATTMAQIAQDAECNIDTVYATVGKKPALFRLLIEMAISGTDGAVSAEEREYVQAIRQEADAARKLQIYATALGSIQPRLAPLFQVLRSAAELDAALKKVWCEMSQRRTKNMRFLTADLAATGSLRPGLSVEKAADIIWSMNSPEFYLLLTEERGWPPEELAVWLGEAWIRLLLEPGLSQRGRKR